VAGQRSRKLTKCDAAGGGAQACGGLSAAVNRRAINGPQGFSLWRRSRGSAAPPRALRRLGSGFPAPRWREDWGIVEAARSGGGTYLRHQAGKQFSTLARVDAFLSAGPEAVDFFNDEDRLFASTCR